MFFGTAVVTETMWLFEESVSVVAMRLLRRCITTLHGGFSALQVRKCLLHARKCLLPRCIRTLYGGFSALYARKRLLHARKCLLLRCIGTLYGGFSAL